MSPSGKRHLAGWMARALKSATQEHAHSLAEHEWPFRREVHSRCRQFPLALCADKDAKGRRRQFSLLPATKCGRVTDHFEVCGETLGPCTSVAS